MKTIIVYAIGILMLGTIIMQSIGIRNINNNIDAMLISISSANTRINYNNLIIAEMQHVFDNRTSDRWSYTMMLEYHAELMEYINLENSGVVNTNFPNVNKIREKYIKNYNSELSNELLDIK